MQNEKEKFKIAIWTFATFFSEKTKTILKKNIEFM